MEWRTIDHTADIGIEVTSESLEGLFEGAAAGMFSLIADTSRVRSELEREVDVEAGDLEELMFTWLNELLYLSEAGGMLFRAFEVSVGEGPRLRAKVSGEEMDLSRHGMQTEVKAATYHGLEVTGEPGAFRATIIFDV